MTLLLLPSRNLAVSFPVILVSGFLLGLLVDTSPLKDYVLLAAVIMIYPSMIGFRAGEIVNLAHARLVGIALGLNFVFVPLVAYLLGSAMLLREPELFAGLAIASVLPSSNMTVVFTTFSCGNIAAAVKLSVVGLVLGSLLAPWYLLSMVGRYIPIDVWSILGTIVVVVFVPTLLGVATYSLILRRYTEDQFRARIKPMLPGVTGWGMVYVVFTSISLGARTIISHPDLLLLALAAQLLFYAVVYCAVVVVARRLLHRQDGIALLFGVVLRHLSISMGLAAAAFGPNAVLMVALAFVVQTQAAAWVVRMDRARGLLPVRTLDVGGL